MKLNIFSSNVTSDAINNAIALLGKQNDSDSEHIVLVPDRFTLSQEKEIYQLLEMEGSINIEVMSFSRFCDSMVETKQKFLSKEGTVMLMKKVLQQNMNIFSYYNNLNISYGFAREMFAVIASLRTSQITPQMLKESAKNADKHKKDKFIDIASINSLYEKALKDNYFDSIARYESLIEALKNSSKVTHTHFYVLGFNIFSQMQINIIKELCHYSSSVTIAAATDSGGANRDIFASNQIEELVVYAEKNNIEVKNGYYFRRLKPPFDIINKEIFAFTEINKGYVKNNNAVTLFNQKNPYEEIKQVAKEIAYLVRQGARYKDIAVVCCQEEYKKCIADIFERCGIPFFIDEKYPSAQSLLAKYVFYIIEVILHNYRIDKVINLIKHPYFGLEISGADAFENYCLKYNINYSVFLKPFQYDSKEEYESIRQRLIVLTERILSSGKANQITDSIIGAINSVSYEEKEGEDILYKASRQSEEKVIELLNEITEVMGNEDMELDEYYSLFAEGVNSLEVALIPQYLDCVFVGNASESRFTDTKYMFAVGASEGYFPLKSSEQTILSYSDILSLKNCGLTIRPDPMENNKLEKFVITDLICRPEKLYVSYSSYNLVGEQMLPGEAIKELSYILNLKINDSIIHNELSSYQRLLYNLVCPENAYYEYMSGRIDEEYLDCVKDYLYSKGYKERIEIDANKDNDNTDFRDYYFLKDNEGNYTTKVSQLESYFCCPYRHYLNYGLKLKEREIAGLRVVDIGNIIHQFLEVFFKENLEKLRELNEGEIFLKASRVIDKVFKEAQLMSANLSNMGINVLNNIRNECLYVIKSLMENIKKSSFTPRYIELSFDNSNCQFKALKVETPKGLFKLRGKIDRVDMFNKKVAIIDYKTGSSDLTELAYIYYGKKIQLYVYMSIFTQNGYQPAGAFYLPIKDGYRSKKERFCFIGQADESVETLKEFDNELFNENRHDGKKVDSEVVSISASRKKDGIKPNKSNSLIKVSDFNNIINYVKHIVNQAVTEISEGYGKQSPLKKECDYCSFKNGCDFNKIVIREKENIKIDVFSKAGEQNEMD